MSRREAERTHQLEREKALYRYSSALDRGDFDVVSCVLSQAGQDSVLERMILEINDVYRAEMEEQRESTRRAGHTIRDSNGGGLFARLREWTRRNRQPTSGPEARPPARRRISPRLRNGLLAGGVVLCTALAFAIGWAAYTRSMYVGQTQLALMPSRQFGLRAPFWLRPQRADFAVDEHLQVGMGAVPPPTPESVPAVIRQPALPAWSGNLQEQATQRMIVREGNISLVVQDTRAAKSEIEEMVAEMAGEGAYVVSSQERSGPGGSPHIAISIRVPVERFDEAMDRLESLAVRVLSSDESGQDVTEEYVDLEARLESLGTARQRLLEIMQDAATTDAVLKAEQQLTQREAEIESIVGRMQYLAQSARLSSIRVDLQPYALSQPVDVRWRPAETAREALETLIHGARSLCDFLIFFAIAVLPWMALAGLGVYSIVRLVLWRTRTGRAKRMDGT